MLFRSDHPDLTAKLLPGYDFVRDAATGADGDSGRDADASDPGDFVTSADVGVVPGCTAAQVGSKTKSTRVTTPAGIGLSHVGGLDEPVWHATPTNVNTRTGSTDTLFTMNASFWLLCVR